MNSNIRSPAGTWSRVTPQTELGRYKNMTNFIHFRSRALKPGALVVPLGPLRGAATGSSGVAWKRAERFQCSSADASVLLQTAHQVSQPEVAAAPAEGRGNGALHSAPPSAANGGQAGSTSQATPNASLPTSSAQPSAPSVKAQDSGVPPPLPSPPADGSLTSVVPYLIRLALEERQLAWRLGAAMLCITIGKMAGITLPQVFKTAVNSLAAGGTALVLSSLFWYGALDCLRVMAKEAQSPIFAPVSQAVTRRVSMHTFAHVLGLDMRFHLDRRTGRVSRILERGARSIAVLYRALIFTFLPTGLELLAVAWLLARDFGPGLAALLAVTFAAYVGWTVTVTQAATETRKEVNDLDNQVSSKAVDALMTSETVMLFGNQWLEVFRYDKLLRDFRSAALKGEYLAALLNAGQGLILAGGMASILAAISLSGTATGGDLVMASGLILQLWAPLQFLGWFYRELRAALVDMEEFFQILRTASNIKDGARHLPPAAAGHSHRQLVPAVATAVGIASSSNNSSTARHINGNGNGNGNGNCHASASANISAIESREVEAEEEEASGPGQGQGQGSAAAAAAAAAAAPRCEGGLEVELVDVSFGYSPERQILHGVSLRVAPGESVAVVGSSGSGKSTILKLVTRLYDVWPEPGSCTAGGTGTADRPDEVAVAAETAPGLGPRSPGVYVNGVDVRELRLAELRGAIAVVPQETALNYDSILENIRYGRPDASDDEVVAAARMARLHDTVMALPEGYNTVVGERGLKLSGGEKQRVAIARAFLRSPRLLICDEATSALDSATEAAIMESLKELATGRSALFVAHRLSTVRNCDRIVVLRGGQVVEQGSHDQLMARRGVYAGMWALQASRQSTASIDEAGLSDSDTELADLVELGLGGAAAAATTTAGAAGTASQQAAGEPLRPTASTDSLDEAGGANGFSRRAAAAVFAARGPRRGAGGAPPAGPAGGGAVKVVRRP